MLLEAMVLWRIQGEYGPPSRTRPPHDPRGACGVAGAIQDNERERHSKFLPRRVPPVPICQSGAHRPVDSGACGGVEVHEELETKMKTATAKRA